jgi:protein ImuB
LRLESDVLAGMRRAGLRSIGDLLARPRAPLAARFGQGALTRLDALACRIRDPIAPRFEAPSFIAERRFPEGLTQRADIEATLRLLAADLRPLLERADVGARRLEAVFYRVDGAVKHLCVGTSRPLREPARLAALLVERLAAVAEEGLDTGYGFDVLRLCATDVESAPPPRTTLLASEPQGARSDANDDPELCDLIDRLGARLGPRRVLRLHPEAAHLPELAVAAVPAASGPAASFPEREAARPLRLFERPETIEAVALFPDGPPLKFRWRRVLHEIVAYEGPERIAPPWWSATDGVLTRDYFQAQDRDGRLFWLFREGLYAQETDAPRWFLHGLS